MVTLKEALEGKLNKEEAKNLITSFDVLGQIAIIEIPPALKKKQKLIGETLLRLHKNVRTVLKKAGIHSGKYRRQKLEVIAGARTKVAEYRENNVVLRLDVEKVYFSPRLSSERKRIYQLVKPGENVLVMFSGCAPYVAVISRNTKAKEVWGIELNPVAHRFAEENVSLNRLKNVVLVKGDAKKVSENLKRQKKRFDRIVMPLPKDAGNFLSSAFAVAKKGAVVHFYDFAAETEFEQKKSRIRELCSENRKKCRIISLTKCGDYAPRVHRVCIDFKVLG